MKKILILSVLLLLLIPTLTFSAQSTKLGVYGTSDETENGDIRVKVSTSESCIADIIYNVNYTDALVDHDFNIMLGNAADLNLNYNQDYYMCVYVDEVLKTIPINFRGGQGQILDINAVNDSNFTNVSVSGNAFVKSLFATAFTTTGDTNFSNVGFTNLFGGTYYGTWAGSIISPEFYTDTNFATADYVSVTGDSNFASIGVSENYYSAGNVTTTGIGNFGSTNPVVLGHSDEAGSFESGVYNVYLATDGGGFAGEFNDGSNNIRLSDGTYVINALGNSYFDGDVEVTGDSNFANLQADNTYLTNLTVTGDFNATSIQVSGVSFADGGINATGDSNFASLEADNYYSAGNITTTGIGTFGTSYQAVLGDDAGTQAGYFTDGTRSVTLADGGDSASFTDGTTSVWLAGNYGAGDFDDGTNTVYLADGSQAGYFTDGSNYVALADGTYAINANGDSLFNGGSLLQVATITDYMDNVAWDISNYQINNPVGGTEIDLFNLLMYDSSGTAVSIDYENRKLYASDGTTVMLDWSTDGTADFGDNDVETTEKFIGDELSATSTTTALSIQPDAAGAGATRVWFFANAGAGDRPLIRIYGYSDILTTKYNSDIGIDSSGRLVFGGNVRATVFNTPFEIGREKRFAMGNTGTGFLYSNVASLQGQWHMTFGGSNDAYDEPVWVMTIDQREDMDFGLDGTEGVQLWLHDGSATAAHHLKLYHDGTEGVIDSATGGINFKDNSLTTTGTGEFGSINATGDLTVGGNLYFVKPIVKYHRVQTLDTGGTDWNAILWDLNIPEESTSDFYLIDNNQGINVNRDGVYKVNGCIHSKYNAVSSADVKLAVRVLYNGVEARCLQASRTKTKKQNDVDTLEFTGTIYAPADTNVTVQYKVDNAGLDLEGDAVFDSPVSASINFEWMSENTT